MITDGNKVGNMAQELDFLDNALGEYRARMERMHGVGDTAMHESALADARAAIAAQADLRDLSDRLAKNGESPELLAEIRGALASIDFAGRVSRIRKDAAEHLREAEDTMKTLRANMDAAKKRAQALVRGDKPSGEGQPPKDQKNAETRKQDAKKNEGASDSEANEADGMTSTESKTDRVKRLARDEGLDAEGIEAIRPIVERENIQGVDSLMTIARVREAYYRKVEGSLSPERHSAHMGVLSDVSQDTLLVNDLVEMLPKLREGDTAAIVDELIEKRTLLIVRDGKIWGVNAKFQIGDEIFEKQVPIGKDVRKMTVEQAEQLEDAIPDKLQTTPASRIRGEMWWKGFDASALKELGQTPIEMALRRTIQTILSNPYYRPTSGALARNILGNSFSFAGKSVKVGDNVFVAEAVPNIVIVQRQADTVIYDLKYGKMSEVKGSLKDIHRTLLPEFIRRRGEAAVKAMPNPPKKQYPVYQERPIADAIADAQREFPEAVGLGEAMMAARQSPGSEINSTVKAYAGKTSKESKIVFTPDGNGWKITLFSQSRFGGHKFAFVNARSQTGKTTTTPPKVAPKPPALVRKSVAEESADKKAQSQAGKYLEQYNLAEAAPADHPYLVARGIAPNPDLRVMPKTIGKMKKGMVLFPIRAMDGSLMSVEGADIVGGKSVKISAFGGKKWATAINGKAETRDWTIIVEGAATAEAARSADARIVSAFGEGNIVTAVRQELALMVEQKREWKIRIISDAGATKQAEKAKSLSPLVDVKVVKGKAGRDLNDVMRERPDELAEYLGDIPAAPRAGGTPVKSKPTDFSLDEFPEAVKAAIAVSRLSSFMEKEFGYRLEGQMFLAGKEYDVREVFSKMLADNPSADYTSRLPFYREGGVEYKNTDKGLFRKEEGEWRLFAGTEAERFAVLEQEVAFSKSGGLAVDNNPQWVKAGEGRMVSPSHGVEVFKEEGVWFGGRIEGGERKAYDSQAAAQKDVGSWENNPVDRGAQERIMTAIEGELKCRR